MSKHGVLVHMGSGPHSTLIMHEGGLGAGEERLRGGGVGTSHDPRRCQRLLDLRIPPAAPG